MAPIPTTLSPSPMLPPRLFPSAITRLALALAVALAFAPASAPNAFAAEQPAGAPPQGPTPTAASATPTPASVPAHAPADPLAGDIARLREEVRDLHRRVDESEAERKSAASPDAGNGSRSGFDLAFSGYLYTEYFWFNEHGNARDSTFDNHYVNLGFGGSWSRWVSFHTEVEWEHSGLTSADTQKGDAYVEQAYIGIDLSGGDGYLDLVMGRIVVPFGRFDDFHDPAGNPLVQRPIASTQIAGSAWKDAGAGVRGRAPLGDDFSLRYDAWALNGRGEAANLRSARQSRDNNDAKTAVGRLMVTAYDAVEAGWSPAFGEYDDRDRQTLGMHAAFVRCQRDDLTLFAEGYAARWQTPGLHPTTAAALRSGRSHGWFAEAQYTVRPFDLYDQTQAFAGTLRFDYYQTNGQGFSTASYKAGRLARVGQHRWTPGISWLPHPQVELKINYGIEMEGRNNPRANNNFVAAQLSGTF
ncbi:MAG: hypothetical protein HY719_12940 [Planctomycetes bacterium]|nr:hypothetical protein [Planctomycetota bacterium]